MDLLIEHGTWAIVPIGLALSFIYLHVFPKVYPFLVARRLDEEDSRQSHARSQPETATAPVRAVAVQQPNTVNETV